MRISTTKFKSLIVIEPIIFNDERGLFYESFNQELLKPHISNLEFVQENTSISKKNVLRGLHFQLPPYAQAKLVQVVRGSALDIVVDLRSNSNTFGEYFSIELNDKNRKQLYIPRGFAHGFYSLEDNTLFSYKCDNFYHKSAEQSILWNDDFLNINWPTDSPIVSKKDANAQTFSEFNSPF